MQLNSGRLVRRWRPLGLCFLAVVLLGAVTVPVRGDAPAPGSTPPGTEQYGALQFPRDEHVHPDGWDYWWGAADLVTTTGNSYTVGLAFDAVDGVAVDSQELYPHQGPYDGLTVATPNGGTNWGHDETLGRYVRTVNPYVPGVSDLLRYQTVDTLAGGKVVGLWERTSLDDHTYHLLVDHDAARVHPTGTHVRLGIELQARMQKPPLLAGGDGHFWYGVPQAFGYPSRSFQYTQAADQLTGTLEVGQPDGSVLRETVAPGSSLVMTHEYDASPEDLPAGLALSMASQVHPRYPQYYEGGMPWELLFVDLKNGAQLMVAVLGFHDSEAGVLRPAMPNMPQYKVLTTLRLPSGESLPLGDDVRFEHLSYRTMAGQVPSFDVSVMGIWEQAWTYRVSYPGGIVVGPQGPVAVPAFDLGLAPQFREEEPVMDGAGNGQRQRIPFAATGSYDSCPMNGFAWSEIIINWYGHEADDPWFTGRPPPAVPGSCGSAPAPASMTSSAGGSSGGAASSGPPNPQPETGCGAYNPGAETCTYTAA